MNNSMLQFQTMKTMMEATNRVSEGKKAYRMANSQMWVGGIGSLLALALIGFIVYANVMAPEIAAYTTILVVSHAEMDG